MVPKLVIVFLILSLASTQVAHLTKNDNNLQSNPMAKNSAVQGTPPKVNGTKQTDSKNAKNISTPPSSTITHAN
jgi:hypothetical protein